MSTPEPGLRPPYLILALSAALVVAVLMSTSLDFGFGDDSAIHGNVASEQRPVSGEAHGVEIAGPIHATIHAGGAQSIEVEAADSLRPRIITELDDGMLRIAFEGSLPENSRLEARITLRRMEKMRIAGSGDAKISGLDGGSFAVVIDGSGDVEALGSVDRADVTVHGSGDVDLASLTARDPSVRIMGSGNVELGAVVGGTARVDIRGSGNVTLSGRAERLEATIAGSGDLDASELDVQDAHVEILGDGDAELLVRRTLDTVRHSGQGVVTNTGEAKTTGTELRKSHN